MRPRWGTLFLLGAATSGLLLPGNPEAGQLAAAGVSGARALEHVRSLVKLGPRPPGSDAHRAAQHYIIRQLRQAGLEVEEVDFGVEPPYPKEFNSERPAPTFLKNIIGKIPGSSQDIVVLAGHYETLRQEDFVGANDGGSSAGLLLELARVLGRRPSKPVTIWVVFFDGEEAFRQWGPRDGLYGSRHQVQAWKGAGVLERLKAVIVVDMIGDKNLNVRRDLNSTPWLTDLVWQVARDKGYGAHFLEEKTGVEDDHLPFVHAGVPAVDLIDLDYGPGNRYWHTREDTLDKLSPRSFEIVGEVVLETIARLAQRWPGE
ncbi:MAG: M28 family peptidase [Acidobacteria bacterium]|nr:M28 family peptidase [Acidobacteriota bacterium]